LVLGAIVSVGGLLASRFSAGPPEATPAEGPPTGLSPLAIVLGALLAVAACLLALPTRFPFSPGQQLAYGALIGLAGYLLSLTCFFLSRPSERYASEVGSIAAAAGPAIVAMAAVHLVFRGDPTSAIFGCLAGGLLALVPPLWVSQDERRVSLTSGGRALWFFGLALLIVGLGSLLGLERFNTHAGRALWALPAITLAAGLLGAVVGALAMGRSSLARWIIAALVIVLGLAAWRGTDLLLQRSELPPAPAPMPYLLVLGWLAFALVAAFAARREDSLFGSVALPLTGLTALVVAFNLFGGSGAALALAAGLPLSLALLRRDKADASALWLAALGVLFLAYRLFLARYAGEVRADLRLEFGRHYVLLGLAAALIWASGAEKARAGLGAALVHLLALVVLPPVLFFVFGYEALLGLALGLWLWQLVLPNISLARWAPSNLPEVFLPLVTIWTLLIPNWAHFMLGQARFVRGLTAGAAVLLAFLILALFSLRGRAADEAEAPAEKAA
jgi:hypothetical protein